LWCGFFMFYYRSCLE